MIGLKENLKKLCKEQKHIKPYSKSFDYFRIRSFCINEDKTIGNVVMWSHYAGEHTGFCIKYKLSKHFMCQEENDNNESFPCAKHTAVSGSSF